MSYLASSSCFSLAFLFAFLPWVLANRALASDSISNSSTDRKKKNKKIQTITAHYVHTV